MIALVSNVNNTYNVYVAPVDAPLRRIPVSTAGGTTPRWSRSGPDLFFLAVDGQLMVTRVTTTPGIDVAPPKVAFQPEPGWLDFDVSRDGRFLAVVAPPTGSGALPMNVVVNWPAAIGR